VARALVSHATLAPIKNMKKGEKKDWDKDMENFVESF
jgi:N-acetyl-anhydromuramyl-L-alanine amidase AmpD